MSTLYADAVKLTNALHDALMIKYGEASHEEEVMKKWEVIRRDLIMFILEQLGS